MPKINLINPLFQSPYTYLQAAGSDGLDGSARGFHLRWDFLRQLGDEHLPKGNLSGSTGSYPSTSGFNKNNDFVRIYRVPYNKEYTVTIDFSLAPNALTESGNLRYWHYNGFTPVAFDPTNTTDVIISFTNIDEYDTIRTTVNPTTNPLDFIKKYKGVIEAQTVNKLMFKGLFDIAVEEPTQEPFALFRAEAVSLIHDNFDVTNIEDKYFISCRKLLKRLDSTGKRTFVCENISHFRFSFENFYIKKLTLSTYQDHIIGENGPEGSAGNFTLVDQFSLDDGESDSNSLVFKRLEDIPKYVIDQKWPKYNDLNTSNGEFTVKVQNYKDRWLDPLGLKEAVKTYLDLSPSDTQATGYLQSEDPENQAFSEISYLEMIKLVSLDFHAARMLGLGHIDLSKGGVSGPRDGGLPKEELIEFINNSSNSSTQVRNYLVDKAPNSEPVLIAAINRSTPLTANHLKDVLNATPNLEDEVLIAAINRTPALTAGIIQDVLVANSPLSDKILLSAINRSTALPPGTIQTIVEGSYPLSDEVLIALINRSNALPPGTIQSIMLANGPLSDEVLIALLRRISPLPPGTVQNIFLENTPLSPLVENELVNRKPPLPSNIINAILSGLTIAGSFKGTHSIYVMEYVTEIAIENYVPSQTTTHVFMSLPTSQKDYRLPAPPSLKPISYGLFVNNASGSPTQLTDDDGYTPFADERFINLKRERFQNELPYEDFFFSRKEFCLCSESPAIGFGIEYKLNSESSFRKPEINHDTEFSDHAGTPETIFVPNNGNELVYNHEETQEGIHDYALYSVNWFSRVSPISNIQQTDFTKFKKRNTILPPFNFAVQLIQEESPIMFTTQLEQDTLATIAGTDKTLVRATFDWNYNHHRAYQIADYAELFFRKDLPKATRGRVLSKTQLTNRRIQIVTEPYTITSTSPSQVIQPNIDTIDVSRFVGSNFVSGDKTFIVESVSSSGSGNNPVFVLEQIRETSSTDMNNDNIFTVTENFVDPELGDIFLVVENLSEAANWDAQLTKKVYLESFFTVVQLQLQFSDNPDNDRKYTIDSVTLQGSDTEITVFEDIADDSVATPGEIVFPKKVKVIDNNDTSSVYTFTVEGDITTELSIGEVVLITASNTIDNSYTVTNVSLSGSDTLVEVMEAFVPVAHPFYLSFNKTATISALNSNDKTITVAGNITGEIIPPYREFVEKPDGTLEKVIVGGIFENATITEFEDKDQSGNTIPGSRTGVYEIVFNSYQLEDHLNDSIDWHKGIVRIIEDATFLPTALEPDRTTPVMKILQVWNIDTSGATLKLTVFDASIQVDTNYDPINEYVPIDTGASIDVNFHPSYRTYMLEDSSGSNNFNKNAILPAIGEGSRQTFMGIRAIDVKEVPSITSHITNPVILLAQEILVPLPPGIPTGPTFATRPDFYGKATYTFDVEINTTDGRKPHMLVFYRANERKILDELYTPDTVSQILNALENLQSPDADFFTDRWNDLVNVNLDTDGLFPEYTVDGFRFPIPDNDTYSIPQANITATPVFPFNGTTPPGDMVDIVKQAIDGAFLSLTEQPPIYQYINEGKQTSRRKPKIRDNDGQMLLPDDPDFDPVPMAVKFEESGETFVRFTDYTLDGAARNFYFYYGIELTNQLKISGRSPIAGPIKLINAFPAEEPAIKKVTSQLSSAVSGIPPAVRFEVNDYIKSEGIKKIDIYRTTNPSDSLSIRTMQLAKSVEVGDNILDDFSDVAFPLYGDPLFYRIVAQREIQNEEDLPELIPSKPSNVVLTNIVDNVNPQPPELSYTSDAPTGSPLTLNNVELSWAPTCYNGTYYLQVMTTSGNWHRIFEIKSNDPLITVDLVDTDLLDGSIAKEDEDGNTIYKRFRVQVENSSGLLNLAENELTI